MLESYFPDSSAIRTVAYDEEAQELTIGLSTGRTYVYRGVESWVYEGLLTAKSAGRFYNQRIKDRYPHVEVLANERSPAGTRRLGVMPASRRRLGTARRNNARAPLKARPD
jgi:hypothetical protein